MHSPDSAQAPDDAADAKKGKIRRIAGGDDAADAGDMTMNMNMGHGSCGHQPPSTMNSEKPEKKPRKKCTMEMSLDATRCVVVSSQGFVV